MPKVAKPKATKQSAEHTATKRRFKPQKYKTLRVSKTIKSPQAKIPSVWKLGKKGYQQLLTQPRLFLGITLVYGFLTLLFVRGLSGGLNPVQLKESLNGLFSGSSSGLQSGLAVFGVLLGSASATKGDLASLYQTIILVLVSLALIWALRQTQANPKLRVKTKEAFYKGCAPVVQFVLVIFTISLQLLPLALANLLYAFVIGGGFAATPIEKGLWYILIFLLLLLTLYMITSSIFALYIVTLYDTSPMQALRAARELVRFRRWTVMRKVLVLPIALILLLAIVTLPSIFLLPVVAEWVFFIASILILPLIHSYMYALYRSLL
jgi:hypothetical protein